MVSLIYVDGRLLVMAILGAVAVALFILLIFFFAFKMQNRKLAKNPKANKSMKVKGKNGNNSKYPLLQKMLYRTKFTYTISNKDSDDRLYFIKVSYLCFDSLITYHLYVPRDEKYLNVAKKEIKKLIDDDTLCIYTLNVLSFNYKEFIRYATY